MSGRSKGRNRINCWTQGVHTRSSLPTRFLSVNWGRLVNRPGTWVDLPNGGGVGLRTDMTRSPGTAATIDVNIPNIQIDKIKFNP
jgi:hypothetical protein